MSGVLASVSGLLNSSAGQGITGALGGLPDFLAAWSQVRPASFRGVPFVVDGAEGDGGRRIVTHEFPLRDKPFTEDMGRAAQRHRIRAFVIGDDYQSKRDALLKACQDNDSVGTLVHPWLGTRQCRAGRLRRSEAKDRGDYAAFDIEFVEAGDQASALSIWDTVGTVLHAALKILPIIKRAYAIASLASKRPGYLAGFGASLFGQIGESLLGLPPATLSGLRSTIAGMSGAFGDDSGAADAVNNAFQGVAINVVNSAAPPVLPVDGVSLSVPVAPRGGDLTGGLLALTGWGGDLPAVIAATPLLADMAAQQAAVVGLVRGAATVAVLQVYAAVDWPSAQAASAALTQVLSLIDARTADAADAGLDDLFFAWQAIGAMAVEDVARRAAQAPSLARYDLPGSLSSLELAQLLYGDAARAEELEGLNDAMHPAFMPRSGFRLVP
jgi:prophage DNA circulation protein